MRTLAKLDKYKLVSSYRDPKKALIIRHSDCYMHKVLQLHVNSSTSVGSTEKKSKRINLITWSYKV